MDATQCKIPGCSAPRRANGWCDRHNHTARRHNGDPLGGRTYVPQGEALAYYFAHRDDITDQCMTWPYGTNGRGYGVLWLNGRLHPVHALACEWHHGPRPPGMFALHAPVICHAPLCFNAKGGHVFWGTPKDNNAHMVLDGTTPSGERQGRAKLTWEVVADIRRRYAAGGITYRELSAEYIISQAMLSRIINGLAWKV